MAQQTGSQQESVADALARRVEARRGVASRWAEAFRELGAVDRALYETVARTPTAELDEPARRLSDAANYSRLWLGIAATIALVGGGRGRRAALEGVVAIGVTSATVNLGVKPLARRRRPDRAEPGVGWPTRGSTPACTIRAMWCSAPSSEPQPRPWWQRHPTVSQGRLQPKADGLEVALALSNWR